MSGRGQLEAKFQIRFPNIDIDTTMLVRGKRWLTARWNIERIQEPQLEHSIWCEYYYTLYDCGLTFIASERTALTSQQHRFMNETYANNRQMCVKIVNTHTHTPLSLSLPNQPNQQFRISIIIMYKAGSLSYFNNTHTHTHQTLRPHTRQSAECCVFRSKCVY